MTTRILFVGDLHLSDQPPLGRVPGYREHILAKLEEIGRIVHDDHHIDAVCFLGDIFHSKRPMFTSHYLVQKVQDILDYIGQNCQDVFILPGNHDQGPEGLNSLHRQPLGVLRAGAAILGWQADTVSRETFSLISRPYHPQRDLDPDYYRLSEEEKLLSSPRIMVAHGSLIPPGDSRPYPVLNVGELAADGTLEGIDYLVSGHIHEALGLHLLKGGTVFCNPGALSRPSRTQDAMTRQVQVWLLDHGNSYDMIPLTSALPAAEVFLAPGGDGATVTDEIADFADALAEGLSLEDAPIEQLLAGIDGVSVEVKEIVRQHLEGTGT